MIISFMASAKQIAWRKKFARMSKAGKFKKSNSSVDIVQKRRARATGSKGAVQVRENLKDIRKKWDIEEQTKLAKRYSAKGRAIMRKRGKKN